MTPHHFSQRTATLGVFDEMDGKLTAPATPGFERIDNITDEILTDYRQTFGKGVTKDDIFFYVYGLLHSRDYRAEFQADLKKMLPRIPKVKAFSSLSKPVERSPQLHLNYETVEPNPLIENVTPNASLRVIKMRIREGGSSGQQDHDHLQRRHHPRRHPGGGAGVPARIALSASI